MILTKTSQKVEEKGKELENMREKYVEIRELVHKVPVGCHAFQIERAPPVPSTVDENGTSLASFRTLGVKKILQTSRKRE